MDPILNFNKHVDTQFTKHMLLFSLLSEVSLQETAIIMKHFYPMLEFGTSVWSLYHQQRKLQQSNENLLICHMFIILMVCII